MKKWILLIFLMVVNIKNTYALPLLMNKTIAIVNDQILLDNDVQKNIIFSKMQFLKNNILFPNNNFLYKNIEKKLIIDKIILNSIDKIDWKFFNHPLNFNMQRILKNNDIKELQFKKYLKLLHQVNNYSYQDYQQCIQNLLMISAFSIDVIEHSIHIKNSEINSFAQFLLNHNKTIDKIKLGVLFLPFLSSKFNYDDQSTTIFFKKIINNSKTGFVLKKINYVYQNKNKNCFFSRNQWVTIKNVKLHYHIDFKKLKKEGIYNVLKTKTGYYIFKIIDFRKKNKIFFKNEFLLKHIMVKYHHSSSQKDQSYKKIKSIYFNIKNNLYSFEEAAKKFSEDVMSSYQGGNLGWLNQNIFKSNILLKILQTKKQDISIPILLDHSWHIFRIDNIRSVNITNDIAKQYSYHFILHQKINQLIKYWRMHLYNNNYVKILHN
ncbi:Chaperone SurA [Buchnera aphidicola (Eriosoma grossulariae)]|uniref:peptidylprolyl isomerase n=1 Tax=Buchnera aphidicola TaxID=9 RepID=UPI00346425F9